jgi:hypothetical protein
MDTKDYPTEYPNDAVQILKAMSFGDKVVLLGSMSLRSQLYAADYDAFEEVSVPKDKLVPQFKKIVKRTAKVAILGDIKSGVIPEWKVMTEPYSYKKSSQILDSLVEKQIVTPTEAEESRRVLKPKMTRVEQIIANKEIKYHTVRWSYHDVMRGYTKLRDGRKYTLLEAFQSPSITKLDAIGFVQNNRFTEFSMVYEFRDGNKILNQVDRDFAQEVKDEVLYYRYTNNPFKTLKRIFSLAKFYDDRKLMNKLIPVLNSDLGRLYALISDIDVLIYLLEEGHKASKSAIKFEIDQFKGRMNNIYTLDDFIRDEPKLVELVNTIVRNPNPSNLTELRDQLQDYLNRNTPKNI